MNPLHQQIVTAALVLMTGLGIGRYLTIRKNNTVSRSRTIQLLATPLLFAVLATLNNN